MRFHLAAFGGAAQDLSAGLVTVPNIPSEPLLRFSNNVLQLSDDWYLLASFSGGIGLSRLRINSASSRIRGFPNLNPLAGSTLSGSIPPVCDFRHSPLPLKAGENVTIQATNGAANNVISLLIMARPDVNFNINPTGLRWIRWTATVTTVAFSWGPSANVVLDDDLEAGRYNVYGMYVFEADMIAARLIFKDQVERPGFAMPQLVSDQPWKGLDGGLGLWGQFDSITPPFIEPLHVAAAAQTLTGYMLVGKAS